GGVYRLLGNSGLAFWPGLGNREMSTGAYLPRCMNCTSDEGPVRAREIIMSGDNPAYIPALPEPELLAIVRRASVNCGPCTDYVIQTARALRETGIRDARLERIARRLEAQADDLPDN